jgi:hypothetical protein
MSDCCQTAYHRKFAHAAVHFTVKIYSRDFSKGETHWQFDQLVRHEGVGCRTFLYLPAFCLFSISMQVSRPSQTDCSITKTIRPVVQAAAATFCCHSQSTYWKSVQKSVRLCCYPSHLKSRVCRLPHSCGSRRGRRRRRRGCC